MSNSPEEIRAEIERTRANLSNDVDALADQANPKNIARRKVDDIKDDIKGAGVGLKDRIMGTADDVKDKVTGHAHNAGDAASGTLQGAASSAQGVVASVGDRVSSAGDTVSNAPQAARQRTQGNPLAAGLIAFGAGLLISSLIPASQREKGAASDLKDRAEPLKQQLTDVAKDIAGNLKEPAQEAAAS
jgi:hypothetical protein